MGHLRRTEHKTRAWARIIQLLRLFNRNQRVFLAMYNKSWALDFRHSAQIIELVCNQKTEKSHFASRYVFDRRQWRHQDKSTWLKLRCQICCRPAAQGAPKNDNVLLPKVCLFNNEPVCELCISIDLLFWWAFRVSVNPISRVLDSQHVDLEGSSHMV